jgi:hypothetical protein
LHFLHANVLHEFSLQAGNVSCNSARFSGKSSTQVIEKIADGPVSRILRDGL